MIALLEIHNFLKGKIRLIKRFLVRFSCQFVLHNSLSWEKKAQLYLLFLCYFVLLSLIYLGRKVGKTLPILSRSTDICLIQYLNSAQSLTLSFLFKLLGKLGAVANMEINVDFFLKV